MSFNVNTFKSNLSGDASNGVSKQSHYEMYLFTPQNILLSDNGRKSSGEVLRFKIEQTELPGRSIITSDYKQHGFGLTSKIGYGVIYPDISVTMVCDKQLNEKRLFHSWQSMIVGNHSRQQDVKYFSSIGYYNNYVSGIVIVQYDQEGNPTYTLGLQEAYPIIINSLPLSWGSEELHRLTVQFTYKYFQEIDEPALGNRARTARGRGGLAISGLPSVNDILGEFNLPRLGDILGIPAFNTNSFTIR